MTAEHCSCTCNRRRNRWRHQPSCRMWYCSRGLWMMHGSRYKAVTALLVKHQESWQTQGVVWHPAVSGRDKTLGRKPQQMEEQNEGTGCMQVQGIKGRRLTVRSAWQLLDPCACAHGVPSRAWCAPVRPPASLSAAAQACSWLKLCTSHCVCCKLLLGHAAG